MLIQLQIEIIGKFKKMHRYTNTKCRMVPKLQKNNQKAETALFRGRIIDVTTNNLIYSKFLLKVYEKFA